MERITKTEMIHWDSSLVAEDGESLLIGRRVGERLEVWGS